MQREPYITTDRLTLSPVTEADREFFEQIWNERSVQRTDLGLDPHPFRAEDVEEALSALSGGTIALVAHHDGQPIGYGTVQNIDERVGDAEIGVAVTPDEQQRGFGGEIISGLVEYTFEAHRIQRISMKTRADNDALLSIANSLGFEREGTVRRGVYAGGELHDLVYLGLLKEDRDG